MRRQRLTPEEWIRRIEADREPRYSKLQVRELKMNSRFFWVVVAATVGFAAYQVGSARTWDRASEASREKSQRVYIGGACEAMYMTVNHLVQVELLSDEYIPTLEGEANVRESLSQRNAGQVQGVRARVQ